MRTHKTRTAILFAVLVLLLAVNPILAASADKNVAVIVNNSLYNSGQISASLNQYVADLTGEGWNPTVVPSTFANGGAVRDYLAQQYNANGIAGAVFVGTVYTKMMERTNFGEYEKWPIDLYFQDLDGTWTDVNSNGYLDTHSGDITPEIWVGRIVTNPIVNMHSGRTEAGLINDYFARNHAYRTKQYSVAPNGLTYIDDDWAGGAPYYAAEMAPAITGQMTIVNDTATTNATDWASRIQNNQYESTMLMAHSDPTHHEFKEPGHASSSFYNTQIEGVNPQTLFWYLDACSNCNYTAQYDMGLEYVFGNDYSLAAVGDAKVGGVFDFTDYYNPMSEGATIGESLQNWWNGELNGYTTPPSYIIDYEYGTVLLGDPTLTLQRFRTLNPSIPGDANLDGVVNVIDLGILASHYGGIGNAWGKADFSGDAYTNVIDLGLLASNYGTGAIPEPASLLLLAVGAAGLRKKA